MRRRNAIKAIGSIGTFSLGGISMVRGAKPSPEELYVQAMKIHERTNNPEAATNFLRNKGFSVDTMEGKIPFRSETSDEVSTEDLNQGSLKVNMSLTVPGERYESQNHLGRMSWTFESNGNCNAGTWGKDKIGLTYKEGSWYVPNGTDDVYMHSDVSIKSGDYEPNGLKFRFKDLAIENSCWDNPWWYCAAPLKPADDSFNPDARQLWGVYCHKDK